MMTPFDRRSDTACPPFIVSVPRFGRANGTRLVRRVALAAAAFSMIAMLGGCGGGGTTSDVEAPPLPDALPDLSGTVYDGATLPGDLDLQVTVKGNVGTARSTDSQRDNISANYAASLFRLSGPYLIGANAGELSALSVATEGGTANVTSLTTLVVAELLGREPFAYFNSLGATGGFTEASEESIHAAQMQVKRYLQREFEFEVPPGIGDFITTPFQPVAGDPMFDTIAALTVKLGNGGNYRPLAAAVGEESGRCRLESVSVTAGSYNDRFCPFTKRNEVDEIDMTVNIIGFSNQRGDALTLRTRGDEVLSAQLLTREGAAFPCGGGTACQGITLGTPAGDLTRPVTFAAASLSGTDGTVVLQGSLQSAVPGIALPGLLCTNNLYYLIHPDRIVEGYCAALSEFIPGAAGGSANLAGGERLVYGFGDANSVGPFVEVVTLGDAILRVLVRRFDPETGLITALFQCRNGCPRATLGPVTVDNSSGAEAQLRTIDLDGVLLAAVMPDGTLSATESLTIEASLTGFLLNDPSVPPALPVPCSASAPNVAVTLSDEPEPENVCVPDDTQGNTLSGSFTDEFGNTGFFVQNLLDDGAGGVGTGSSVTVIVSDGAVLSVSFQGRRPTYRCDAAACTGVIVSAPNGAGETTVTFSGTALQEIGTGDIPADRTATLNGSFVAPPPEAPPPEE